MAVTSFSSASAAIGLPEGASEVVFAGKMTSGTHTPGVTLPAGYYMAQKVSGESLPVFNFGSNSTQVAVNGQSIVKLSSTETAVSISAYNGASTAPVNEGWYTTGNSSNDSVFDSLTWGDFGALSANPTTGKVFVTGNGSTSGSLYSLDGKKWFTATSVDAIASPNGTKKISYVNGAWFLTVANASATTTIYKSVDDGVNWTQVYTFSITNNTMQYGVKPISGHSTGIYVLSNSPAASSGSAIGAFSLDGGTTWSTIKGIDTSTYVWEIAYLASTFYAVNTNNNSYGLFYTTDLSAAWTGRSIGITNLTRIISGGNTLVALNGGGDQWKYAFSTDGTNWTVKTSAPSSYWWIHDIEYFDNKWYVAYHKSVWDYVTYLYAADTVDGIYNGYYSAGSYTLGAFAAYRPTGELKGTSLIAGNGKLYMHGYARGQNAYPFMAEMVNMNSWKATYGNPTAGAANSVKLYSSPSKEVQYSGNDGAFFATYDSGATWYVKLRPGGGDDFHFYISSYTKPFEVDGKVVFPFATSTNTYYSGRYYLPVNILDPVEKYLDIYQYSSGAGWNGLAQKGQTVVGITQTSGGSHLIYYSTNGGTSWTQGTMPTNAIINYGGLFYSEFHKAFVLAIGATWYLTNDFLNYSSFNTSNAAFTSNYTIHEPTYMKDIKRWVGSASSSPMWSDDSVVWYNSNKPSAYSNQFNDRIRIVNGVAFSCGGSYSLASTDGKTWTTTYKAPSGNILAVSVLGSKLGSYAQYLEGSTTGHYEKVVPVYSSALSTEAGTTIALYKTIYKDLA